MERVGVLIQQVIKIIVQTGRDLVGTELLHQQALKFFLEIQDINTVILMIQVLFIIIFPKFTSKISSWLCLLGKTMTV